MSPSELHREKQDFDFKVIKASAKGVLTQLQKKREHIEGCVPGHGERRAST